VAECQLLLSEFHGHCAIGALQPTRSVCMTVIRVKIARLEGGERPMVENVSWVDLSCVS
jgi:hypothetical protein